MKQNFYSWLSKNKKTVIYLLSICIQFYSCKESDTYRSESMYFFNFLSANNIEFNADATHWFIISSSGCVACRNPKSIENKLKDLTGKINIISSDNIHFDSLKSEKVSNIYKVKSTKIDRLAFFTNITYLRTNNHRIDSLSYFK